MLTTPLDRLYQNHLQSSRANKSYTIQIGRWSSPLGTGSRWQYTTAVLQTRADRLWLLMKEAQWVQLYMNGGTHTIHYSMIMNKAIFGCNNLHTMFPLVIISTIVINRDPKEEEGGRESFTCYFNAHRNPPYASGRVTDSDRYHSNRQEQRIATGIFFTDNKSNSGCDLIISFT